MRRNCEFYAYLILTCAYAISLFFLSSKSSLPQSILASELIQNVKHLVEVIGFTPLIIFSNFTISNFDKVAHAFLYFIFEILVFLMLKNSKLARFSVPLAILVVLLYGLTDEFHQYFVPGRDASVFDFAADCIGIAIAQLILMLRTRWKIYKEISRAQHFLLRKNH